MITYKKVVLIINSVQRPIIQHFEAITLVENDDKNTVMTVWGNNKIPAVLEDVHKSNTPWGADYIVISNLQFLNDDNPTSIKDFTVFCHENGFECGEYVTGHKFDTKDEACILCQIGKYKALSDNLADYNAYVSNETDCIIYESRHFYVTSELGSLKPGFLMIVPKKHYLSVANFPPEVMDEYVNIVCPDIEKLLKGVYGAEKMVTFFEHGSAPSGLSSHKKSIVHAHTHVIVDFTIKKQYRDMIKMVPISDITVAKHTHYFSYQEGCCGQLYITMDDEVYVQRQFARQILAMELNLAPNQYNWREMKQEVAEYNVVATLYNIYQFLTKCDLPASAMLRYNTRDFVEGYRRRISDLICVDPFAD